MGRLRIHGVADVKIRLHCALQGTPKTCTIIKKPDGWWAHIVCELPDPKPGRDTGPAQRAALDLGVGSLAMLHTGERVENPCHLRRAASKLRSEQRALSRKQRGSRRRAKQRERLARAHLKVARARRDYLHKLSRKLAQRYMFIAVEDLPVAAMTRSARGTVEKPGRRVRQKAGLNRSILDAAWGELRQGLAYKLAERGGSLVPVDKDHTSQTCSQCGTLVPYVWNQRWHDCPHCGLLIDRDYNAALNIHHRSTAGH